MKEGRQKQRTYYVIPSIQIFRKYKPIYSDRRQISDCLGKRGKERLEERIRRGKKKFLEMIDIFTILIMVIVLHIYVKLVKLYTLNI